MSHLECPFHTLDMEMQVKAFRFVNSLRFKGQVLDVVEMGRNESPNPVGTGRKVASASPTSHDVERGGWRSRGIKRDGFDSIFLVGV